MLKLEAWKITYTNFICFTSININVPNLAALALIHVVSEI